jgi:hypothetical protein
MRGPLGRYLAEDITMPPPVIFLATSLLLSIPSVAAAQVPQDLREAMQARVAAVWKKDTTAWSRLTADEFTVVVPEGRLQTKADRLASLAAEPPEPPHPLEREQIHIYGDAAAVRRFIDGSEWVLEVWARQKGAWRVVASQVNLAKS